MVIELEESAPAVDLKVDILGLTGEEQYETNPYMDQTWLTYSMCSTDSTSKRLRREKYWNVFFSARTNAELNDVQDWEGLKGEINMGAGTHIHFRFLLDELQDCETQFYFDCLRESNVLKTLPQPLSASLTFPWASISP